jgi:uncharacterized protein YndB with AHSA1/START domain/DNA-binding HxlR family transcriptional regulator
MSTDAALKALAEPHRRAILRLVRDEPRSVNQIAEHFEITQQAVSLHLKVLREAGLVGMRRDGQRRLYLVDPDGMDSLQAFLADLWPAGLDRLKRAIEDPVTYRTFVEIAAPPETVYPYFTRPEAIVTWMGDYAVLKAVPGGLFHVDINGVPVRGRYLELDPPHRLLISWGHAGSTLLPPGASTLEITFTRIPNGTRVTVEHRDLPPAEADQHAIGWAHFLARLTDAAIGNDPGPDPFAR